MFERIADWFRFHFDWEDVAIVATTVAIGAAIVGWVVFTFIAWYPY